MIMTLQPSIRQNVGVLLLLVIVTCSFQTAWTFRTPLFPGSARSQFSPSQRHRGSSQWKLDTCAMSQRTVGGEDGVPKRGNLWRRIHPIIRTRHRVNPHDEVTFRNRAGTPLSIPQAERYSSSDWVHNIFTIPTSVILNRIKMPLLAQVIWATMVSTIPKALGRTWCLSMKPHTLLGSALGLLLVFRTNAAYQRFQEGRKIWEDILNSSRDIARMGMLYETVFGRRAVIRIANLLATHAVILKEHLQGYKRAEDWEDLLPQREVDELMETTCNRPLMMVNKIAKEVRNVAYEEDWSSRERLALLSMVNKLGSCIGGCERLVQTPVPLHYVRHTSRFLTLWCFMLPLVLVGELGLVTVPIAGLATWALFGIQEIGLLIEDPFQTSLQLGVFCSTIFSDVMQTIGAEEPVLPQQPITHHQAVFRLDMLNEVCERERQSALQAESLYRQ